MLCCTQGGTKGAEYFAGYILEQSLSVDNLFVFILVFKYFRVPREDQDKVRLRALRCDAPGLAWQQVVAGCPHACLMAHAGLLGTSCAVSRTSRCLWCAVPNRVAAVTEMEAVRIHMEGSCES